ncbi:Purple acid phosphatase 7 [Porphyridium purpureum]|uniref:Purple acid phosphatase 7 n=1 Tax=Porphyridium purpureum TaxID=35688 RepID=A0A5J4YTB2_PORPP|nr:Purple acid phosphatase 7 [Porphyridium purpureum]|eukprot:POR0577..scf229_5
MASTSDEEEGAARSAFHGDDHAAEVGLLQKESAWAPRPALNHRSWWISWHSTALWTLLLGMCLAGGYLLAVLRVSRSKAGAVTLAMDIQRCDEMLGKKDWRRKRHVGHAVCSDWSAFIKYPDPNEEATQQALISSMNLTSGDYRFLVFGDWGRDGFCCQRDVAQQMEQFARLAAPVSCLINVGDNFYPVGIQHHRAEQVQTSWTDVYLTQKHPTLAALPWISVLGNHDWYGDPSAVLKMHDEYTQWYMPARWYSRTVGLGSDGKQGEAFFAFLDTSVIFYSVDEEDMTKMKLDESDIDKQLSWLDHELSTSRADWKIVVGHHPVTTSGSHAYEEAAQIARLREKLHPLLVRHKVAAYFCGHDHDMQHLTLDGVHYYVSGAGSQVRPIGSLPGDGAIFGVGMQGFLMAQLSKARLHVRFVSFRGSFLYEHVLTK